MGTLRQAVAECDGISIQSDEKLKSITNVITQILEREKREVRVKIKHEESHVKKVKERLKSLQNNSNNGGPVNVVSTDGNTLAKLWREFDLRRSSAMEELLPRPETSEKTKPVNESITKEDSKYLRNIADSALDFCCKEYKLQQEQLAKALNYCPKENGISKDQREAARSFQMELETDVTQHLFQKCPRELVKDSEVIKKDSRIERYLKACVDVSWYVQVYHNGAKFVWDIPEKPTKESFSCITYNCKKRNTCDRRVCRPALSLNGRILNPGIYSCVSCVPDNNALGEKQNMREIQVSTSRANSASNTHVHLPCGEVVNNQPEGQSKENRKEAKKGHSHEKKRGSPRDEKSPLEQKKAQGHKDKGKDSKSTKEIEFENKNSLDF